MKRPPRLLWTRRAYADLVQVGDFIARDNPAAAERMVKLLMAAAEKVRATPRAGRRVPELRRDDLRELVVRGYRLVYRLRADRLTVLTVFERHRLLPEGLDSAE